MSAKKSLATLLGAGILFGLGACGGGGGSSGGGDGGSSASLSTNIVGTASKGTLKSAIVTAYAVTPNGQKGDRLGTARTNNSGYYSISVTRYSGPIYIELTSDVETKMTCDIAAGCGSAKFGEDAGSNLTLSTVVAEVNSGITVSAITPFTHLAAQQAASKSGGYSKANIEAGLTQVAALFNLPSLNATQIVDVTSPFLSTAAEDAQHYALLNAAIGQLSGSTEAINTKLAALSTALKYNDGQLKYVSSRADEIDLSDVLSAASSVAADIRVSSRLSSLASAIINQDLNEAKSKPTDSKTTASPASLAGADNLLKAKAFAQSVHNMVLSIKSITDNSDLESQLQAKYKPVKDVLDTNATHEDFTDRLPLLFKVAGVVAEQAFELCKNTCDQNAVDASINANIQAILDTEFNTVSYYGIQSTATNLGGLSGTSGIHVTVNSDSLSRTITLNGQFKLKQAYNYCSWSGYPSYSCSLISQPIDQEVTYTFKDLRLQYPLLNIPQKVHVIQLMNGSRISSPGQYLQLNGDSGITVTFGNDTSVDALVNTFTGVAVDALEPLASSLPESIVVNLSNITLGWTATPVNFQGNISLVLNKKSLPVVANTTKFRTTALPSLISFKGIFTGVDTDSLAASVTFKLDATNSNPLIAPEYGYIRSNLFNYSYDARSKTAVLKVNASPSVVVENYYSSPSVYYFTLGNNSWYCGGGNYLQYNFLNSYQWFYGCTSQVTVQAALQEAIDDNQWNRFNVAIQNEGAYVPRSPSPNLGTATINLDGLMTGSNHYIQSEDAAHFASGALSLQATINLSIGATLVNADIRLDAERNAFDAGTGALTITFNGRTLKVVAPVTGGKPAFTLSDMNGASVDVSINNANEELILMVNGVQMGKIYKLNGLSVARFVDNSLIAL